MPREFLWGHELAAVVTGYPITSRELTNYPIDTSVAFRFYAVARDLCTRSMPSEDAMVNLMQWSG